MKKYLFTVIFLSFLLIFESCSTTATCYGPMPRAVAKYISANGPDIENYPLSSLETMDEFYRHEREYEVYMDSDNVWRNYRRIDPKIAFEGRIIDFGLLFNPDDSTVYTQNDSSPYFAVDQIYILNLKVLGFYNFPVAFKVTRIDSEAKLIEFIYMQKNIANGYQRIYFEESYDANGVPVTRIRHISVFKSEYKFQDRILYPPFHRQTIDDFHRNVFIANRLSWSEI